MLYAKIRAYPKKGISPSAFSFSTKGSAVDGPSSGISDNERSSSPAWSQTVGSQVLAKRGHPPPPEVQSKELRLCRQPRRAWVSRLGQQTAPRLGEAGVTPQICTCHMRQGPLDTPLCAELLKIFGNRSTDVQLPQLPGSWNEAQGGCYARPGPHCSDHFVSRPPKVPVRQKNSWSWCRQHVSSPSPNP